MNVILANDLHLVAIDLHSCQHKTRDRRRQHGEWQRRRRRPAAADDARERANSRPHASRARPCQATRPRDGRSAAATAAALAAAAATAASVVVIDLAAADRNAPATRRLSADDRQPARARNQRISATHFIAGMHTR